MKPLTPYTATFAYDQHKVSQAHRITEFSFSQQQKKKKGDWQNTVSSMKGSLNIPPAFPFKWGILLSIADH